MGTGHTESRPEPLRGCRKLNDEEKALLDRIKLAEEEIAGLWAEVHYRHSTTINAATCAGSARDLFRQAFMELVRTVAKPRDPYGEAVERLMEQTRREEQNRG
jgi:hypothetical protein